MELVSMVTEVLQNVAEHVASYRIGQTALRCLDRTLWVVEKCARWAVPPPLDQDERPQPELVRPLPWVFFLSMLIILRVMRESISLANLIMGKPPLRSADVVIYIQGKRRYLRTLKYQGNRIMRARTGSAQPREPWYTSLRSMFEFTMCFRRNSLNYGNNNTTSVSNNDEVLVVKRSKRGREDASSVASSSVESTMERLIEKMMVDLNADSDEDSTYTLTDATSPRNEKLELTKEDQDTVALNSTPTYKSNSENPQKINDEVNFTPSKDAISSTPEKTDNPNPEKENPEPKMENPQPVNENPKPKKENSEPKIENPQPMKDNREPKKEYTEMKKENLEPKKENSEPKKENPEPKKEANQITIEDQNEHAPVEPATLTPKQESINFIQNERCTQKVHHRTPKNEKIANGRTVKSVSSKKKGSQTERRDHIATTARLPSENKSF